MLPAIYIIKVALGVVPIILGLHLLLKPIDDITLIPHQWFRDVGRSYRKKIIRGIGWVLLVLGIGLGIGVWFA